MQLQFKRNNIAGKGMQLSVGAIQLNLNRLSTLFNYQCGNARIHFTNEFAVGELKLQSSGLEQNFCMRSKNGFGMLGAANSDWMPNRKKDGVTRQNVVIVDMAGEHIIVDYVSKKGQGLFGRYAYWNFEYKGHAYDLYQVGLGRKGIFLCVYMDNETVAQCQLNNKAINYENEYIMYAMEGLSTDLLVMIMTLWDVQGWFLDKINDADGAKELNKKAHYHVENYTLTTVPKDLKEKYDPNFIQSIMI